MRYKACSCPGLRMCTATCTASVLLPLLPQRRRSLLQLRQQRSTREVCL
jgi:hypothetical protein